MVSATFPDFSNRLWGAPSLSVTDVDDNACRFLPVGKILFQIVFSVWVTFRERKWITFA